MKHLAFPISSDEDAKVVKKLCKDKWMPHHDNWIWAYENYYKNAGNPWLVSHLVFNPDISDDQYDLYDSRKVGGPIKRIRETKGLLCCPVCGSSTTGHVDHYLPRTKYQEFSIMRANLVPACGHCNSGVKGSHVKGVVPERFIHPYFDKWADEALWCVKFIGPLQAVRFEAEALDGLSVEQKAIVGFHLNHVLGTQFHRSMENAWATLPQTLVERMGILQPSLGDVKKQLGRELRLAVVTSGENSWDAAFFRGLIADSTVVKFLLVKVNDFLALNLVEI